MGYRRLNPAEKLINRLFSKRSMISEELLETKIRSFSRPTTSYFMLLVASIIIATLGLLMNASAIVIGSMIISPLTWPMFGLADGASLGNRKRIWANLILLAVSIVIGVLLAYALTILSPLKVINAEIIARSQPTLLDAVVALTAGGIGTLALVRKNISDSVAGVAVALSLTPPLCVLGISLALGESSIVSGSFLLLLTNALSITLIAGVFFILIHYSWRRKLRMAPKAFVIMALSLLLTAVPLYQLLNKYSLETSSYSVVQSQLDSFVRAKNESGSVRNIQTSLEEIDGKNTLEVEADLFLPITETITIQDQDRLAKNLESDINRPVSLKLNVQTIAVVTNEADEKSDDTAISLESLLEQYMLRLSDPLTVLATTASEDDGQWVLQPTLSGNLSAVLTPTSLVEAEEFLAGSLDEVVSVSLQPTYKIVSSPDKGLTQSYQQILDSNQLEAQIGQVVISEETVVVPVTAASGFVLDEATLQLLDEAATSTLGSPYTLEVRYDYYLLNP
ncbi:MAG: DUF389 domain-containing protein [Patescibacteria group bacterium]